MRSVLSVMLQLEWGSSLGKAMSCHAVVLQLRRRIATFASNPEYHRLRLVRKIFDEHRCSRKATLPQAWVRFPSPEVV
jgi:hypothetical protein